MGPATAANVSTNEKHNGPPCVELRAVDDGSIEIWFGDQQAGAITPEPGAVRLIFGDADPGSNLTIIWDGGPASFRIDLSGGLP